MELSWLQRKTHRCCRLMVARRMEKPLSGGGMRSKEVPARLCFPIMLLVGFLFIALLKCLLTHFSVKI